MAEWLHTILAASKHENGEQRAGCTILWGQCTRVPRAGLQPAALDRHRLCYRDTAYTPTPHPQNNSCAADFWECMGACRLARQLLNFKHPTSSSETTIHLESPQLVEHYGSPTAGSVPPSMLCPSRESRAQTRLSTSKLGRPQQQHSPVGQAPSAQKCPCAE